MFSNNNNIYRYSNICTFFGHGFGYRLRIGVLTKCTRYFSVFVFTSNFHGDADLSTFAGHRPNLLLANTVMSRRIVSCLVNKAVSQASRLFPYDT